MMLSMYSPPVPSISILQSTKTDAVFSVQFIVNFELCFTEVVLVFKICISCTITDSVFISGGSFLVMSDAKPIGSLCKCVENGCL